jgi:hypothetical protein
MDAVTTTAITAASLPIIAPLLDGAKDRVKALGKDMTDRGIDALAAFWRQLTQSRPETRDLALAAADDAAKHAELERLMAEAIAADPNLKRLAEQARAAIAVGYQSGGVTQIAGDGSVQVTGDVQGGIQLTNKGD